MNDREKVIDGLNETISYLRLKTGGVVDRCIQNQYDALELLKEQKPKPVKFSENSYGHKTYYCPKCGRWFEIYKPAYCDKCGQAVKWDG